MASYVPEGWNKTCTLPVYTPLDISPSTPWGVILRTNDSLVAMDYCCGDNSVNLMNDCYLWCTLPSTILNEAKIPATSHESNTSALIRVFKDCLNDHGRNSSLGGFTVANYPVGYPGLITNAAPAKRTSMGLGGFLVASIIIVGAVL